MPQPAPAVAAERAEAVFEATIDGFRPDGDGVRFDLTVHRVFKGDLPAAATLVTQIGSAACGRRFVPGRSYLIYAHRTREGDLGDTSCSRTRLIATADEDLAVLGAGAAAPAPVFSEDQSHEPPRIEAAAGPPALAGPGPRTRSGCDLGGASGPGIVAVLALLRRRRRR